MTGVNTYADNCQLLQANKQFIRLCVLQVNLIYRLTNIISFIFQQKIKLMTTQQVAERLTELCRKGEFDTAYKELFADDAVSIEPEAGHGFEKETHGLDNLLKKAAQFGAMVQEVHGVEISEPIVSASTFAIHFAMDVTMKGQPRSTMSELCLYKLKDGKIISEEFFM